MARNPNNELQNHHTAVLGTSGSGKSRWIAKNPDIAGCARVVLWDPEGDHKARHAKSRSEFVRLLKAALQSGAPFRIAYEADNVTPDEFEWWCGIVWAMLDGRYPTIAIVEEIADVSQTGRALRWWGQLARKGRKYNLRLFVLSQRPQEVDKTTLGQCPFKWAGALETELDRKAVGRILSLTPVQLEEPGRLNEPGRGRPRWYWWKAPGAQPAELRSYETK